MTATGAKARNAALVAVRVYLSPQATDRLTELALGGVDLTSSAGAMTLHVLNAVAQFERDLLIERTQAGLSRAKAEKGSVRGSSGSLCSRSCLRVFLGVGQRVGLGLAGFLTAQRTVKGRPMRRISMRSNGAWGGP
jgi:putative DNA-invertase from lambdoid prophage Rac